jgi:hypothetical protein
MDKDFVPSQEKPLIPYEQSFSLASQLEQKHHDELVLAERPTFGKSNMPDVLSKLPNEVRARFYGHGVTRGGKNKSSADKLAAFINILDNSTIKGDQGPLESGQLGAYTNVDFLIVSHLDRHLNKEDQDRGSAQIRNEIGWVADIGAYVIGSRYYPIIDDLKVLYPDKNIIKADEIPGYVNSEINS